MILNYTSEKSSSTTQALSDSLTQRHNVTCLVVQADVSKSEGPKHIIATAKNHFSHPKSGAFRIDILVNNAGVSYNTTVDKVTIEDFDWQYRINVLGPLLMMQAVLPHLPQDRSGRVVNLSSVSSSEGFTGQSVYGGTKAALEAMTRTWARELGERATVNAVNPGPVNTDMWSSTTPEFRASLRPWIQKTPGSAIREHVDEEALIKDAPNAGGRPAYTSEIAGVVAMLCSEDSVWCTGQVVCANGGMRMAI